MNSAVYEARGPFQNLTITKSESETSLDIGPDFFEQLPPSIVERISEDNRSDHYLNIALQMTESHSDPTSYLAVKKARDLMP